MTAHRTKLLVPIVLIAACSRPPASTASQTGASTTLYKPSAIVAWLDCVECTKAQLNAVAALGDAAIPDLRGVLLSGPQQDRLNKQQQYLEARYRALQEYQTRHPAQPVPSTQQEYVRMYMDRFILLNRVRSARALGAIATPAAKEALNQAVVLPGLSSELLIAIKGALELIP